MATYSKYPNPFEIYKTVIVGDPNTGGGVSTKEILITGLCAFQRGTLIRGDKQFTYDFIVCFDVNDQNSIPAKPDTININNSCIVSVYDEFNNHHEGLVSEQTHNHMGSTVYFNEINNND